MNVLVPFLVMIAVVFPGQDVEKPPHKPDLSDTFFGRGMIPDIRIQISEPELEKLRAVNRKYVRCTLTENRKTYKDVAIKLKGAAGSFREIDDRPALTLNFGKFNKGQLFHNLNKLHLNNSVQDETLSQEWLCEELFRSAGVPATRVTHARVWLNDRDLGLYVLKEGFDESFLKRHFEDPSGNLYDGGFVQDIDQRLEKDAGEGPDDHRDLISLLEACRDENPEERWRRIDECLDVDAFITFMAMELMTSHWDGYTQNSNNFRIYFNPADKKARFFPHGMDQMFRDPGTSIMDYPGAIVSSAVMHNPDWRARYRERVKELLPLFDPPDNLQNRLELLRKRLRPHLHAIDPQLAIDHAERVKELKELLATRAERLRKQAEHSDPRPMEFHENAVVNPTEWSPTSEPDDAVLEEIDVPEDKRAYSIRCGPNGHCVASWRCKVVLPKGSYTFQANVQTKDVAAIDDEKGSAAGLRISGASRANTVEGTSVEWQTVQFEFVIEEEKREVVLVAELRTTRGEAWFEVGSLQLTRKPEE